MPVAAGEQLQKEALKTAGGQELSENKAAAKRMQQIAREKGHRAALEDARKDIGVPEAKRKQAVESNIYLDPAWAPGSADRVAQENKRTTVEVALTVSSDFVKNGFDRVNQTTKDIAVNAVVGRMQGTAWLQELGDRLGKAGTKDFAKELFKDPQFKVFLNRELQERASIRITDVDKNNRLTELQRTNPGATLADAAGQLEAEWQTSLELNSVIEGATSKFFESNLVHAEDVVTKHGAEIDAETQAKAEEKQMKKVDKAAEKLEKRWAKKPEGKENVKKDFETLVNGGLDALLQSVNVDAETRELIEKDSTLRTRYEENILESLVVKRMRTGEMTKADFYRLVDAKWCGVDKLQEMIEKDSTIQEMLGQLKESGKVQGDFWERFKKFDPTKRSNILWALLAALAMPVTLAGTAFTQKDFDKI